MNKAQQYRLIEQAISILHRRSLIEPRLTELAAEIGLSEGYFQRLFTQWAGVSPKRYVQFLKSQLATSALQDSASVLDTSLAIGLSGPGRLHDLMITTHAMTPGEVRQAGKNLTIRFGQGDSPFGQALIGLTERGICHLSFSDHSAQSEQQLKALWPEATFIEDQKAAHSHLSILFDISSAKKPISLLLKGSNFQLKVWQALLTIPMGKLTSYSSLAAKSGSPAAQRAVGSALAANQIACLIPCHRVIRANHEFGQYRWGTERKQLIHAWEVAQLIT